MNISEIVEFEVQLISVETKAFRAEKKSPWLEENLTLRRRPKVKLLMK